MDEYEKIRIKFILEILQQLKEHSIGKNQHEYYTYIGISRDLEEIYYGK